MGFLLNFFENNFGRWRPQHLLVILVPVRVDIILEVDLDLVVHLCVNVDTAETGNNSDHAKS